MAAYYNDVDLLKCLIDFGVDINSQKRSISHSVHREIVPDDSDDYSALYVAALFGRLNALKCLLQQDGVAIDTVLLLKDGESFDVSGPGLSLLLKLLHRIELRYFDKSIRFSTEEKLYRKMPEPGVEECFQAITLLVQAGANIHYTGSKTRPSAYQFYQENLIKHQDKIPAPIREHFESSMQDVVEHSKPNNDLYKNQKFYHQSYALMVGANQQQEKMLLLSSILVEKTRTQSTRYTNDLLYEPVSTTVWALPGGPILYSKHQDLSASLHYLTCYQTGVDLKNQSGQTITYQHESENLDLVVDLVTLNQPIEQLGTHPHTYKNGRFAKEYSMQNHTQEMTQNQWVPINTIEVRVIVYEDFQFPAFFYQEKPLPYIATLPLMKLCHINMEQQDKIEQLAIELHSNRKGLLQKLVATDELQKWMALESIGFFERVDLSDALLDAFTKQETPAQISLHLLQQGVQLHHYYLIGLCLKISRDITKPEPKDVVLALFHANKSRLTSELLAAFACYAAAWNMEQLSELVLEHDPNLISMMIKQALKSGNGMSFGFYLNRHRPETLAQKQQLEQDVLDYCDLDYPSEEQKTLIDQLCYWCLTPKIAGFILEQVLSYYPHTVWKPERFPFKSWADVLIQKLNRPEHFSLKLAGRVASAIGRLYNPSQPTEIAAANNLAQQFYIYPLVRLLVAAHIKNKEFACTVLNDQGKDLWIQSYLQAQTYCEKETQKTLAELIHPLKLGDYQISEHSELDVEMSEEPATLSRTVYICSEAPDKNYHASGTGDVDYTTQLAIAIQQANPDARIVHLREDAQMQLEQDKNFKILHLIVNTPHTGCAVQIDWLRQFKKQGNHLVVTALEFAKYPHVHDKQLMLDYLLLADRIIFLDEFDKKSCMQFAATRLVNVPTVFANATILYVPPTIAAEHINAKKEFYRTHDIICFGMLRAGKGFAHVIKLAQLIKASQHSYIKNIRIHVVGSVQKQPTRRGGREYDATLYKLLCAMHPKDQAHFLNKSPTELMKLANNYHEQNTDLPIVLHLDAPPENLAELFKQCPFAFYPAYRGATLRNSSVSTALAYGCLIYSHYSAITPEVLKPGGTYEDAMVLLPNDDYHTYADNVLKDIHGRYVLSSYKKEERVQQHIKALAETELNIQTIAHRHGAIYQSLSVSTKTHSLFKRKEDTGKASSLPLDQNENPPFK
jgi:glycosyltransferase involved in cell wall biosynthesis